MFFTQPLGLSVCVCVTVIRIVTRWLDLATRYQVRLLPLTTAQKCNIIQMIHWQDPDHMDHLYKITFWPITSKLTNGFTSNFTYMLFSLGLTIYIVNFEIHREIKMLCMVSPKKSSTSYFHSICLKLTLLIAHYTETIYIYIKYHTTLFSRFKKITL